MKVKYIGKKDTVAFERERVYEVLDVEKGWFRIMTELEEDYLFPPEQFEVIEEKAPCSKCTVLFLCPKEVVYEPT